MTKITTRSDTEKIQPLSDNDSNKLDTAFKLADRPEEFAKLFCTVAKEQTSVKNQIIDILKEILMSDVCARNELKHIIQSVQKEDWRNFVKSAWGKTSLLIWTIVVAFVTAIIGKYIK